MPESKINPANGDNQKKSSASFFALLFAMTWPTVVTYLYFDLLHGQGSLQSSVAGVGKLIQFAFPAIYVLLVLKRTIRIRRFDMNGVVIGLVFGAMVSVAMFVIFFAWLKSSAEFVSPAQQIREKIASFTWISGPMAYASLGLFYALFHSLLEEYYWRWFVFRELEARVSFGLAVLLSGLGFMAHHVLVLAYYFGWTSWLTYFCSAGVAIGGFAWAWLYRRSDSLYGPWLSHMLVDAAIFTIGYDVVRTMFQS